MGELEHLIQSKAYSLGYEECGMIPIGALDSYAEKLEERIQRVPEAERFYQGQRRLTNLQEQYPWAKSVIVAAMPFGRYKLPEHLQGRIAKYYLFDLRVDTGSEEYRNSVALEQYLQHLGLRLASNRKFGAVGLREAARKAGLGIVRRNNFFYTKKSGSWVALEAWITDRELELTGHAELPECPKGCGRCVKSCPSCALSAPYTLSPNRCISFLTTHGGRDLPDEPLSRTFGEWIYGCEVCQDVCPMNKDKWKGEDHFPGVPELSEYLTPERILEMEEDYYKKNIQPRFFYLKPDELWKWKVNALCFMRNNYVESYRPYILAACENENEKIREMARSVCKELFEVH